MTLVSYGCIRPLSEPKELKSRFDAIFDVTGYVKALDNIKKMTKDLVSLFSFGSFVKHFCIFSKKKSSILIPKFHICEVILWIRKT